MNPSLSQPLHQACYSLVTALFTPAATPTDVALIQGAANRVIEVIEVKLGGTATALAIITAWLLKRSTANAGGTFVAGTAVPHDSADSAAQAVAGHYTVNPVTPGTLVGTVSRKKITLPIATSPVTDVEGTILSENILTKPIILRGVAQQLAINLAGAANPAGAANWYAQFTWIER